MKKKEREATFRLQGGAAVYAVLLVFSLIFTQSLRNAVSGVLFIFVLLLPVICLATVLIGRAAVQVYVSSETTRAEKGMPVGYEIRIINSSPLPFPFVEAYITQPGEDGVRCLTRKMYLSLTPFSGHIIKKTVAFKYRGLYEIGVSDIYISDPLRMFRAGVHHDNYSNIIVYPRILSAELARDDAYTEMPSPQLPNATTEFAEPGSIREYRSGDPQKSIHWKLSSKTEELQVKDYSINRDRNVYVFADLSAPTPPPEEKSDTEQQQVKLLLNRREKKKIRLKDKGTVAVLDAADKLTGAFSSKVKKLKSRRKDKKAAAKDRRRMQSGKSEKEIETINMIDSLIDITSGAASKKRREIRQMRKSSRSESRLKMKEQLREELIAEENAERELIEKLYAEIDGSAGKARSDPQLAWGGRVKEEYEDDMPEFCCDGVIEIALAAVKEELEKGNKCTLVWYDKKSDTGYFASEITGSGELSDAYEHFSRAATVNSDKRITELAPVISEASNVTVRIATANIDPVSLGEYSAVPAMFGGAGTGCVCQLLLYNPCGRYENPDARRQYSAACRDRLLASGIQMTELVYSDSGTDVTLSAV